MGLYNSFYDEDSECPKCHAKITSDWQTKHLENLMESWRKGDFFQYRKLETISKEERERKYGDIALLPLFRRTENYLSDAPLLFNGTVPVHQSCDSCKAWLEAYAKIASGRFAGIVDVEADREEKELVIIKPEATAETLREEFEGRLSHLRESCAHEKAEWMNVERRPGHSLSRELVCLRCEKVLQTRK